MGKQLGEERDAIPPEYERSLLSWLEAHLG
jgi:hypothetical protein